MPPRWYEAPCFYFTSPGYTIFNDWSARDIQRLEDQLPCGFFKGKDGAHTLGP